MRTRSSLCDLMSCAGEGMRQGRDRQGGMRLGLSLPLVRPKGKGLDNLSGPAVSSPHSSGAFTHFLSPALNPECLSGKLNSGRKCSLTKYFRTLRPG